MSFDFFLPPPRSQTACRPPRMRKSHPTSLLSPKSHPFAKAPRLRELVEGPTPRFGPSLDFFGDVTSTPHTSGLVCVPSCSCGRWLPVEPEISSLDAVFVSRHAHYHPHPPFWPMGRILWEMSTSYLTRQPWLVFHPAPMYLGFLLSPKSHCLVQVFRLGMLVFISTSDSGPR